MNLTNIFNKLKNNIYNTTQEPTTEKIIKIKHYKDIPPNFSGIVTYSYDSIKSWHKNGFVHRENDLPAIEYSDGTKIWYQNNKRHRENGPAYINFNGTKRYFIHDKEITICTSDEQFKLYVDIMKLKGLL